MTCSNLEAAETSPSTAELESIRVALATIQGTLTSNRAKALKSSIAELSAASATQLSAINAYVEAVRIDQFGDGPGAITKFQDWRKKSSDVLSNAALRTAAQLHLRYLQLTLDRAADPDGDPALDDVVSYLREAAEMKAIINNPETDRLNDNEKKDLKERIKKLTDEPMDSAPFVRAYRIGPLFADLKDWEMTPGNLPSILDRTVRPILREKKDSRLVETWDLQISTERGLASDRDREDPDSGLNRNQIPRLEWAKANDQYAIGDRTTGLRTMVAILQANPEHPDATKWIDSLSGLLEKEAAQTGETAPGSPNAPESSSAP